ncbi:histone-lysine N-methyltransferase ASHH2 isoform X1 [Cucurbita moschata]|uniref:Histone-lysine N-methyltransferase ASHH2 isoform X1 n=1 Tax=Cucurbita moschata TaxID=3662 RepID=A0A6J1FEZ0_CUCMO|nr:histone-lysine N-methyltransferase ASHH2 isoform X1 [Cucurbita moschata]XP_022938751.1 histone-lysine N-methyltransferase ASHH2 isoform X1 [Cucurbita moschata]XP_022938752.1 histone-lysine N-methyltransferase ASHH2 isoform X1 [Cucurbita moschata]
MGSCDDPAVIGEPVRGSITPLFGCSSQPLPKYQSRQEMSSLPSNSSDCQMLEPDRGLGVTATNICTNASEPDTAGEDGTSRGFKHADTLLLDKRLDCDSGDSDPCLNEENEACNVGNGALSLDMKESQDVDDLVDILGCKTTMEMMSLAGSLMNSVKPEGLDNNSCIIDASEKVESGDIVENGPLLSRIGTCTDDLKSPHICEIVSSSASADGLSSDFIHQKQLENDGAGCSFSEVADRLTEALVEIEADILNEMSPLQSDQILPIHMARSVANCEQYICQMDGKGLSGTSGETVNEFADMNSNPELCLQILPSQGCERIRECLQADDSPLTIHSPEINRCDEKHDSNSLSKYIPEVVEDDFVVLTDNNGDGGQHIVPDMENNCNLEEASIQENTNCVELLASPLPFQPFNSEKYEFYGMLIGADMPIKDNSCSVSDQDNNDTEKVGHVSEVKCPETVLMSSKRSGRRRPSSQKNVTKRASRKSKKIVPEPLIFDTTRRRRSSISRPARPLPWGSLGFIIQSFEKIDDALANQSKKQGNEKSKGNQGGTKRSKKQPSESSHRSRKGTQGKCDTSTSTNRIRLKVKLGKNVGHNFLNIVVPEIVDSSLSAKGINCHYGNESYWEGNLEFPPSVDDQKPEEGSLRKIFCYSKNEDKEKKCPDASVVNEQCANNDSSCTVTIEKSSTKHADDNLCVSSHMVEPVERAIDTRSLDPGTSPDSEVINSMLDIQVGAMRQEKLQDSVLPSLEDFAASGNASSSKKGRKKEKPCQAVSCSDEAGTGASACNNRSKSSKKHGRRLNADNQLGSGETFTYNDANVVNYSLTVKELSIDQVPLSTEIELPEEALKADGILEDKECYRTDVGSVFLESENSKTFLPSQSARKKHPKGSKSIKTSKGKSKAPGSKNKIKNASKERVYRRKSFNKSIKEALCDRVVTETESHQIVGNYLVDKPEKSNDIIESTVAVNLNVVQGAVNEQYMPPRNAWVLCDDCHKWRRIPASLVDSLGHASCTWTCKDNVDKAFADCSIPQEKSNAEINAELEISDESGEENASNKRLTYRELDSFHPTTVTAVPQENKFTSISSNHFLHRSRKTQTIDEIMVCHCKPALDGRLGCGDECLNRMLNIECVRGTCPCGDLCSNQQFQKRKYAKLRWLRCGKKGYGLQSVEDISKGQFLIEYVGEVLDMHAYEARQKEYALNGHRHFYFMTLDGSEVIDACGKGNLGRFINHSCDPNCRTEKWMVNGEICIGLFALRDIKKGEEVTFDYNYVRVFGAAAKKCYCGSFQCRGYIGGDPLNSEVIIQSDSDEEFPEPVMLRPDGRSWNNNLPTAVSLLDGVKKQPSEHIKGVRDKKDQPIRTAVESKISDEKEDTPKLSASKISEAKEDPLNLSASTISPLHSSLEFEDSKVASPTPLADITHQTEDVTSQPVFVDQPEISPGDNNSDKNTCSIEQEAKLSVAEIDARKKSKLDAVEDKKVYIKSHLRMKTSRKPGSIKKGKVSSVEKVQITNRPQISSVKPKRLVDGSPGNRFEAVEEKLNELLDAEGGISKRKDAPKGYLKLLLLTAASGASASGEAIQSNRDLSMILDALLKTKSRVVLTDIINKNGLRMLHNIMKQYRSDFKKIPILRKLLKVLEYLVMREILTSEHINGGPPCPGMESLRDSLLSLTEHDDKQVHQIARSFRDRWFPRHTRKFVYSEREDGRLEVYRGSNCSRFTASHSYRRDQDSRPTDAIDCVKQSMSTSLPDAHPAEVCTMASTAGHSLNGQKVCKRKSRWDQPADTSLDLRSKEQKLESKSVQQFNSSQLSSVGVVSMLIDKVNSDDKDFSLSDSVGVRGSQDDDIRADSAVQNIPEDIPPGFSPFSLPVASSSAFSTVLDPPRQSIGKLSSAFSTVGYPQEKFISCLPVSYGIPFSIVEQCGTSRAENLECWDVAPGVPFHPFPPLPPYPRGKRGPPTSACGTAVEQSSQEMQVNCHDSRTSFSEENPPSTSNYQQDSCNLSNIQQTSKRAKESSYDLGRKYFRQEKWRNTKFAPPRTDQWGYQGNFRSGVSTPGDDNIPNEGISLYCSDEASGRGDKANDDFYQHLQNQNQR